MARSSDRQGTFARRMDRRRLLALGAAGAGALLAACSGEDSEKKAAAPTGAAPAAAGATADANKPRRGGSLTLSIGSQLGNLHPQESGGSAETRLYVYDHLFNYDYINGTYEMSAAASLEQPEANRIVFKMDPGSKWQPLPPTNGRQLTSEDCAASFTFYAQHPRASGAKQIWTQDTERLETPDPMTLVVVLKQPNPWAIGPHGIAGPIPGLITPKELHGGDTMQKTAVGSGGYQLGAFDPTSGISFVRRPDSWHGERPYIDRIAYKVISDETARTAAFRAHQIDALEARDKLQADEFATFGKEIVVDRELDFPRQIWMRADRPPFNDERVRQAVYLSLDIKGLIQKMDLGEGELSGPIPAHLKAWSLPPQELASHFPVDVKKAADLLRAANFDFNRQIVYKLPNDQKSVIFAELVQQQLAAAGIKTRLTPEDPRTVFPQTLTNADLEFASAARYTLGNDGNVWVTYFSDKLGTGTKSPGRWSDSEIDALIDRQRTELDADKRKALLLEIQRLFLKKFSPGINPYSPYLYAARWANYRPVRDKGYVGSYGHHTWIAG